MPNNETLAFAEAVRLTLAYCGAEVFGDPQRFATYLNDMTDSRLDEMRVLRNNCTAELLAPFKEADRMTSVDLKRAAGVTQEYLVDECLINADTSRGIARGIAEGVALWRGITISWDDTSARAVVPDGEPEPSTKPNSKPGKSGAFILQLVSPTCLLIVLVAIAVAFPVWKSFGWRLRLDKDVWVVADSVTTLTDGTVGREDHYSYDYHGNLTERTYTFKTAEGETYTGSDRYLDYDKYGYPKTFINEFEVSVRGEGVTGHQKTTQEMLYHVDFAGRLGSKVTETKEESKHEGDDDWQEWDSPLNGREAVNYTYADGLPFGLQRLWWVSESGFKHATMTKTEVDRKLYVTHSTSKTKIDSDDWHVFEMSFEYELGDKGELASSSYHYVYQSSNYTSDDSGESVYDDHGNVIKRVDVDDGERTVVEYQNEYDSNGNLSRCTNLTDGSVTEYKYRHITSPSIVVRTGIK